jgi:hypothetical protein
MHDRHLAAQSHTKRTEFESYHWAMAAQMLNYEISQNSNSYDPDAVWMGAALMSWMAKYAVETQNPDEVWPLSPKIPEIPWLAVQKGLRIIWELVGGGPGKSVFFKPKIHDKFRAERCIGLPPAKPGIEGIPKVLADLCDLDQWSTPENNPYHTAVHVLSDLLVRPSSHPRSLRFLAFINTTNDEFETLLRQKDARSLLLMAIWYNLAPKPLWWFSLRASLERKAICIYLDRYHADDPVIQRTLATI